MLSFKEYARRLRIWEANFGRDSGWAIERHGKPIAVLTEPRDEEMFWESYRLEIVTEDAQLREQMLTNEFWAKAEAERLVWRSREFGDIAESAIPALSPLPEPGRLMMRGLYLAIDDPRPWDRIVLWARSWFPRLRG